MYTNVTHLAAGTVYLIHNIHVWGTNVVLVPQPSTDVNNSHIEEVFCPFASTKAGFIGGFSPALCLEFDKDLSTSAGLILWAQLISGIGVSLTFWASYTSWKMLRGQSRANRRGVIKLLGQQNLKKRGRGSRATRYKGQGPTTKPRAKTDTSPT
jgi:hypothetical protein